MRFLVFITFLLGLSTHSLAGELQVILNGKAIHFDEGNYNEENWGLGLQYDFTTHSKWTKFVHASWFKDSNYNTSVYAGGGTRRRYQLDNDPDGWFFEAGAIAFLMTRKDYNNNRPFAGILPFIAVGEGPVTLNITYIPEVSPKYKDLLYFQLMIRLYSFD